ncbi:MAG: segregation/condensation protein A [Planctomycetota bacterium]
MTYTVSLENFSGPLDLLLYLVKQEEVEIHEIPISVVCDRYLEYLTNLENLDVDLASEFLVMASTLMLIKSRSLLPAGEEIDLEEELDPEDELIQQLLEYKQFKMASRDLEQLAAWRSQVFPYTAPRLPEEETEVELEEIDLWDLVRAFATMLQETGIQRAPRVIVDEKPLREYIEEVFGSVRTRGRITFLGLFEGQRDRTTVIGRFLALLELIKRKLVRSEQAGSFDSIEIVLQDDRDLSLDEILNMEAELLAPASEEELEFMDQLDENDLANGDQNTQDSTGERLPSSSSEVSAEDAEVSHGSECS